MIERDDQDGIAVLHLVHGSGNRFDLELSRGLDQALAEAVDDGVAGVVLAGKEGALSAGFDLERWQREDDDYARESLLAFDALIDRLLSFPRPVAVAVVGRTGSTGLTLCALADVRMRGARGATITLDEPRLGLPLPAGMLAVLRDEVGRRSIERLLLLEEPIAATHDRDWGFCDLNWSMKIDLEGASVQALVDVLHRTRDAGDALGAAKAQLRAPLRRAVHEARAAFDDEVLAAWCDPGARERLAARDA